VFLSYDQTFKFIYSLKKNNLGLVGQKE